jgi:prepilin-type N-terminal cleavage/methylation domain-containing protein
MRAQKKIRKGFTLVEVIVVAVIVAILAAVAIPIYQQYLQDSRTNSAANVAGSLASFSGACLASSGTLSGIATTTTAPGQAVCTITGSVTATTSVIPARMTIAYTARGATPGAITVSHSDGGSATTMNF